MFTSHQIFLIIFLWLPENEVLIVIVVAVVVKHDSFSVSLDFGSSTPKRSGRLKMKRNGNCSPWELYLKIQKAIDLHMNPWMLQIPSLTVGSISKKTDFFFCVCVCFLNLLGHFYGLLICKSPLFPSIMQVNAPEHLAVLLGFCRKQTFFFFITVFFTLFYISICLFCWFSICLESLFLLLCFAT